MAYTELIYMKLITAQWHCDLLYKILSMLEKKCIRLCFVLNYENPKNKGWHIKQKKEVLHSQNTEYYTHSLHIKQQYANSKNLQTLNNDSFTCQPSACSATSSYHYNAEM